MKENNLSSETLKSRILLLPPGIPRVRATLMISCSIAAIISGILLMIFILLYGVPNSANWAEFTSSLRETLVAAAENVASTYATLPGGAEFVRASGLYNPETYVDNVMLPMLPMLPAIFILFCNVTAYAILFLYEKLSSMPSRVEKQLKYKPIAVCIFIFAFFYNMLVGMTPNHPTARAASMICLTLILMYLPGFFLIGVKRLSMVNPLTGRRSMIFLVLFPFLAAIAFLSGMWNILTIMIMMIAYMGAFGEIMREVMTRRFRPPSA